MNKKWLIYTLKVISFCVFMSATASQSPSIDVLIAEEQMDSLRKQILPIFEELKSAQALLQSDPSDEAVRGVIGKLVRKFNIIKAKAEETGVDIDQEEKVIASILGDLPKKPKNIKMEQPVPVLLESQKISVTSLPPLALKSNTFGYQEQLPHEGQPFKKHVAGLLTYFPYQVSPARGIIVSSNGSLKKEWDIVGKSGNENPLMKKMFNSLDDQIVKTHLGGNPVMGLSPKIIGQLVHIIYTDPALLLQLDEAFFQNWHASYMAMPMPEANRQLKNYKDHFKKEAKDFLKILQQSLVTENGKQDAIDLLLSYMMMSVEDAGIVVTEYAKGLSIEYVPVYFTDQDYEEAKKNVLGNRLTEETIKPYLEQLIFFTGLLVGLRKYISCTTEYVTYKGNTFPMCKEVALRKLLSLILYNPETGRLDLQMLPEAVQKTVSQELKQFFAKYGDRAASEEEVMQAFLDLIENKLGRGIVYADKTYEITGEIDSGIAVLRMLFGIEDELKGSASEQFEQLLHLLFDSGKRSVKFDEDDDDGAFERENNLYQKSDWKCIISFGKGHADDDDNANAIKMVIHWSDEHGSLDVVTLHNDIQAAASIHNLYVGGKVLNAFLLGSSDKSLPCMLHYLVAESILTTKEDFVLFFTEYRSQFGKNIPETFNDSEVDWQFFFKDCSKQVFVNVVQAAIEMGLDKKASEDGVLRSAFLHALRNRDFDLMSIVCDYCNPPNYFFSEICASDFSEDQKKELIKKLFVGGLFSDCIAYILHVLNAQSIRLLPQGSLGIDRADSRGNTLIMLAFSNDLFGSPDKFNLLLKGGAKLDAKNDDGDTIVDLFLKEIRWMEERLKQPITLEEYSGWDGLKCTFDRVLSYRDSIDLIPDDKMDPVVKEQLKNAYKKCAQNYRKFKKKI